MTDCHSRLLVYCGFAALLIAGCSNSPSSPPAQNDKAEVAPQREPGSVPRAADVPSNAAVPPNSRNTTASASQPTPGATSPSPRSVIQGELRKNTLKLIGLTLLISHDDQTEFPVAQYDHFYEEGKPKLSWRVHLLRYYRAFDIFEKFDFYESAESETNKPLFAKTPSQYLSPQQSPDDGQTRYARLFGPEAVPFNQKFRLNDIKDGPANTIMIVELPPAKAISWGSTTDILFDPAKPLDGIGEIPAEGLLVVMYDGEVRVIKPEITPTDFKALVTPAGGKSVDRKKVFK